MNANQEKSPGAMFRSFANSARSVMEESFLMVTDTHIIELKANKLNMQNIGTVAFSIPIEAMAKSGGFGRGLLEPGVPFSCDGTLGGKPEMWERCLL